MPRKSTARRSLFAPLLLALLLVLPASVRAADAPRADARTGAKPHRLLYTCLDKDIAVYDIAAGHQFVRWIAVNSKPEKLKDAPPPKKGVHGAGNFRGICADAPSARLYVTEHTTDEMICIDLKTDQILWRKKYGKHVDSQVITPDGKTIYLPCREDGKLHIVDATTGDEKAAIAIGGNPHNSEVSADGKRVFLESLAHPWVFVTDVGSTDITGKVGPFSSAVRPFSLSSDGKYVFACVNGLLGFEVGDIAKGEKILRVEAQRPPERQAQLPHAGSPHGCPSHGIGERPNTAADKKEVWVVDSGYGLVYVFDISKLPAAPRQIAAIPLYDKPTDTPEPGWVCFDLSGKLAYLPGDAVIDTDTKTITARIPTSEKMIEIDFDGDKPVKAARRMW